jgi:hypothetical protein
MTKVFLILAHFFKYPNPEIPKFLNPKTGFLMKHKRIFALIIGILLFSMFLPWQVCASDVSVVATVDKTEATMEDYILLKINVKGARKEPSLPKMPEFSVQSRGSSSQVRIVNGQVSSSIEYSYMLYPRKEGVFTIGPFFVHHKGKRIESNRITVQILKSRASEKSSRDIFVTAEVDNKSPHLYEQIIYRFKFFRRVKVANARLTESPSFEGFITENLGKEREYQKVINGLTYVVTEIKQALFPTKTGVLEISPSTLQCGVVVKKRRRRRGFFDDPFFGFSETVPKALRTAPITVMVKPLPASGKPENYKNLVGNFTLTSHLSTNKLEVGESATLTLTLSGTGNLKNYQTINITGLQNFKVYDDKPAFEPKVFAGKVGGKLTIKKALVPLTEGNLQIPPVTVSYFHPSSGIYKTAKTGPHTIRVFPATEKEKFHIVEALEKTGTKQEVKILGRDILPIHTSLDALSSRKIKPVSEVTVVWFLLPVFGFLFSFMAKRVKERNEEDKGLARAKSAYKNFRRTLPAIHKALKKDELLFYQVAPKALKNFIGDKLNIAGSALTPAELEKRVTGARGMVQEEVVSELKQLLEFFDSGQFGFKKHSLEEKEAVFISMKKLVKQLNKKIKK